MYVTTGQHLHLNGPMASIAYDIPLTAQPDIQNLENTQIEESIPKISTHEPFLRGTEANMPGSSGEHQHKLVTLKKQEMIRPRSI